MARLLLLALGCAAVALAIVLALVPSWLLAAALALRLMALAWWR
jgi:hypothetical protein